MKAEISGYVELIINTTGTIECANPPQWLDYRHANDPSLTQGLLEELKVDLSPALYNTRTLVTFFHTPLQPAVEGVEGDAPVKFTIVDACVLVRNYKKFSRKRIAANIYDTLQLTGVPLAERDFEQAIEAEYNRAKAMLLSIQEFEQEYRKAQSILVNEGDLAIRSADIVTLQCIVNTYEELNAWEFRYEEGFLYPWVIPKVTVGGL